MDRRGESEESGDDETRRRSINGDVDTNQPVTTSKYLQELQQPQNSACQLQILWPDQCHHWTNSFISNTPTERD